MLEVICDRLQRRIMSSPTNRKELHLRIEYSKLRDMQYSTKLRIEMSDLPANPSRAIFMKFLLTIMGTY